MRMSWRCFSRVSCLQRVNGSLEFLEKAKALWKAVARSNWLSSQSVQIHVNHFVSHPQTNNVTNIMERTV